MLRENVTCWKIILKMIDLFLFNNQLMNYLFECFFTCFALWAESSRNSSQGKGTTTRLFNKFWRKIPLVAPFWLISRVPLLSFLFRFRLTVKRFKRDRMRCLGLLLNLSWLTKHPSEPYTVFLLPFLELMHFLWILHLSWRFARPRLNPEVHLFIVLGQLVVIHGCKVLCAVQCYDKLSNKLIIF